MYGNGPNSEFFGQYFHIFGLTTEIYSGHFSWNEAI